MRCIGIFGGTFDPIHYGHLRTALELLERLSLESVRFVPCGTPPHREPPMLDADLRLEMVRAATADEPRFAVDAREVDRRGNSYSIDTLTELRAELPDTPLGLILGVDAFLGLPTWHRSSEILDFAHLIVARRPGWELPTAGELASIVRARETTDPNDLNCNVAGAIFLASVTQLEISSTDLRRSIAAGIDPKYLVPPSVREFIMNTESYAQ